MADDVNALAQEYFDYLLMVWPTWGHMMGNYQHADLYDDASRAGEDEEIRRRREFADRAEAIPADDLSAQDRITREMIAFDGRRNADILEARFAEFGADPIFGPVAGLPVYMPKLPIPNADVAEAMIAKTRRIATNFRDMSDRSLEGVARNRTPAAFAVDDTVAQIDRWLARPIGDDPLLNTAEPTGVADADTWRARLRDVIEAEVRPAMAQYRDTLRDQVRSHARDDEHVGLTWLADGDDAYGRMIRYHTTLERSAQEIHEIGLEQVAKLADEYRVLGQEVLGTSDVPEIFRRLRDDPALHHTSGREIVAASKTALAKATAAMGDWFGILPKAGCDVEETQSGAIAFYFPPAKDGSRPGVFFMNTSDPTGWGRYQIEATSYHEGVPGHHLQLAISTELTAVPEFRKRAFIAAYGEGWGLYTERLADEMGLYSTPLDRMGMLEADSMRACRLVVDTGMHALGWSRPKAVDYMTANSPMRVSQIVAEIDRYAVTPGQALAYMIGRLEIQRMRREAEEALGERFAIKGFHDTVLGSGLMPLPVLDRVVREWADGQRAAVLA
ncbi:MAG TPA: DUF885 domain-containing protein [Candidatus Limnocylindrales bacterium]|nr:DUF885 domain-containing protein [Candidatus Limnocylindrales bacterium]